jgi:glutathionylspermidine synthase
MQRRQIAPRSNWQTIAENHGFAFHHFDGKPYWTEDRYWAFSLRQIEDDIETPTAHLYAMCIALCKDIVDDDSTLQRMKIDQALWPAIRRSWHDQEPSFYGRFDLAYAGTNHAKLLEFNADTPTSLFEASIFQWLWLEQHKAAGRLPADADQFNSIHEKLVAAIGFCFEKDQKGRPPTLHLACDLANVEDRGTVDYIAQCAQEAGVRTKVIGLDQIHVDAEGRFVDNQHFIIENLFKLYPWEWMAKDAGVCSLLSSPTRVVEPAWKALLSTKAILPLLWEKYPGHANLLECYFSEDPRAARLRHSVKKPIYSREGAGITLSGAELQHWQATILHESTSNAMFGTDGGRNKFNLYGSEGYVVQAYTPLAVARENGRTVHADVHAVIGSWIVDGVPAGIGIREDDTLITTDTSRFVPHIITT